MAERRYNRAPWEGAQRRGAALSRVQRAMNPIRNHCTDAVRIGTRWENTTSLLDEAFADFLAAYRWDAEEIEWVSVFEDKKPEPIKPNIALLFE